MDRNIQECHCNFFFFLNYTKFACRKNTSFLFFKNKEQTLQLLLLKSHNFFSCSTTPLKIACFPTKQVRYLSKSFLGMSSSEMQQREEVLRSLLVPWRSFKGQLEKCMRKKTLKTIRYIDIITISASAWAANTTLQLGKYWRDS